MASDDWPMTRNKASIPSFPSSDPSDLLSDATPQSIHAVLVPGFWLGGWARKDVETPLQAAGITTHAVTLPGLGRERSDGVTLANHIDFVTALVGGLDGYVVLVGHSGWRRGRSP